MGTVAYRAGEQRLNLEALEVLAIELGTLHRVAQQRVSEEQQQLAQWQQAVDAAELAVRLVCEVAESIQQRVHRQIAQVVTKCLRAVFGEGAYELEIRSEQKRGKTEVQFVFTRGGLEVDPLTAAGGGVVDVAAFGLRLAALLMQRPAKRRLLVLDEPFRFVSAEYQPAVAELLQAVAAELEVQIVMCTHVAGLAGLGQTIEIGSQG